MDDGIAVLVQCHQAAVGLGPAQPLLPQQVDLPLQLAPRPFAMGLLQPLLKGFLFSP